MCASAGGAGASTASHPQGLRGALGVIAPQMTADWSDTKLALEPGTPNVYYVTLDSGATELIAEDWLESAPEDAPPPPVPRSHFPN